MPLSPELQEAVDTAKAGQLAEARSMLKQILRKDPTNESAWFLYARIADTPEHAIVCLKKVLEYNPYNERARRELAKLQPDNLLEKTASDKEWDYNSYLEKQVEGTATKKSGVNRKLILGIGAVILIGGIIAGGYFLTRKLFPAHATVAPLRANIAWTPTTEPCSCAEAKAYSEQTLQRFNDLVDEMDAIGSALNNDSLGSGTVTAAMAKAKLRYDEQRRETPPPCLEPFDKNIVIIFWNWQQALTSLQQGDNAAVISFVNDIVKQTNDIDVMVNQTNILLNGCPIQRPTPPGQTG